MGHINATQQCLCSPIRTVRIVSLVAHFLFVFHIFQTVCCQRLPAVSLLCHFWMQDSAADCEEVALQSAEFQFVTGGNRLDVKSLWRRLQRTPGRILNFFRASQITAAFWQQLQSASINSLHPGAWRVLQSRGWLTAETLSHCRGDGRRSGSAVKSCLFF